MAKEYYSKISDGRYVEVKSAGQEVQRQGKDYSTIINERRQSLGLCAGYITL